MNNLENIKTVYDLKKYGNNLLKQNNIQDNILIVNMLLEYCFNMTKQQLLINNNIEITQEKVNEFVEYINKVIDNIPLEYITNKKNFMNAEIYVNENVLIPRADTEILVENLIEILNNEYVNKNKISILELCTGSGAIPVGMLTYLKERNLNLFNKITFTCVDISEKALEVAKINSGKYSLKDKIEFIQSDLFENIPINEYDILISNPPYIETKTIKDLDKNVQKEPTIALDGGIDGLKFYNEITKNSNKYLKQNGYILYEIGYNQGKGVSNILENNDFVDIQIKKDLSGNDRNVIGRKK